MPFHPKLGLRWSCHSHQKGCLLTSVYTFPEIILTCLLYQLPYLLNVSLDCFLIVFQALQDGVTLNTGPGNNQLSAFIQTKMLCKLRCREETLLSFSGNRLFKQRHTEILLPCRGRIISKMCSAPPYLYWACHSRADFWVCLACGLVPGLFKWGGTQG